MRTKLLTILLIITFSMPCYAIDMNLQNIDGRLQNLNEFKGKWIVVNFWASWCPPCIAEMPDLQQFHDDHADKDAVVVGINVENIGVEALHAFLDTYFITYPNFRMPPGDENKLGQVSGLPTTFLVSPEGNVEATQVGSVTAEMIENFILKWEAKQVVLK